jgi:hypothetical protein
MRQRRRFLPNLDGAALEPRLALDGAAYAADYPGDPTAAAPDAPPDAGPGMTDPAAGPDTPDPVLADLAPEPWEVIPSVLWDD